jgi:hypothetical protein
MASQPPDGIAYDLGDAHRAMNSFLLWILDVGLNFQKRHWVRSIEKAPHHSERDPSVCREHLTFRI